MRSVESRQEGVRMEPLVVDGGVCSTQRQVSGSTQRQVSGSTQARLVAAHRGKARQGNYKLPSSSNVELAQSLWKTRVDELCR